MNLSNIWIVDFGSQYTQLITRKCREIGHNAQILSVSDALTRFKNKEKPTVLVLSGGPDSISTDKTDYSPFFEDKDLPILGICYGMQIMSSLFGGKIVKKSGEYGHSTIQFKKKIPFVQMSVWMSHGDSVEELPEGFSLLCESENNIVAGIAHNHNKWWGLQFHPEVAHTINGKELLSYFLESVAKKEPDWNGNSILHEVSAALTLKESDHVLCAFSGGVDSLVAATLIQKMSPAKLHCIFVDTGLVRPQDHAHIDLLKEQSSLPIEVINARDIFLEALKGKNEPEEKRKTIGRAFIEVFEKAVHQIEEEQNLKFDYLLQGTLYPDVIESLSPLNKEGKSATIKSHHNVGGLPERMKLKLVEPLRMLFKDEVRILGRELQIKEDWLMRHPFPGPGIGIRILGEIKEESIRKVQESDQILFEELQSSKLYNKTWQAFTVLLPVKTVGVKGDARAYEEVICLRLVDSSDGMTATVSELPYSFLSKVSSRITNEVRGITRVVYDITSKPPGTIEWE